MCPLRSGYEKHTPSLGWLEASILAEKQAPSFCGTDDSGVLQETKGGRWLDPMSEGPGLEAAAGWSTATAGLRPV